MMHSSLLVRHIQKLVHVVRTSKMRCNQYEKEKYCGAITYGYQHSWNMILG